ncbi:hypothetical protein QBC39DRAFT_343441, partial [Podospora conica]
METQSVVPLAHLMESVFTFSKITPPHQSQNPSHQQCISSSPSSSSYPLLQQPPPPRAPTPRSSSTPGTSSPAATSPPPTSAHPPAPQATSTPLEARAATPRPGGGAGPWRRGRAASASRTRGRCTGCCRIRSGSESRQSPRLVVSPKLIQLYVWQQLYGLGLERDELQGAEDDGAKGQVRGGKVWIDGIVLHGACKEQGGG